MNEKNLKFLQDNVKYMGFGDSLAPAIEKELTKGSPNFALHFEAETNKKYIDATLHFRKSDTTDVYFFNKYDMRVQKDKEESTMAQTFYINKGHGVTLKEGINLLDGRAVHKELMDKSDQKYNAWIQLDFSAKDKNGNFERKQFHQNYGYDLKEALSYFPVKEMGNDADAQKFLRSLERGNVQSATLTVDGAEKKIFVEANPQYKTVNLFTDKMKPYSHEEKQKMMERPVGPAEVIDKKKEVGKTVNEPTVAGEKKKGKSEKSLTEKVKDLLPKKRSGKSSGLSV